MRRIRLLLAALALGLLATVGVASPASAAGESEEVCLIHTVHDFEEEGADLDNPSEEFETAVSDCFEAPNPLMPEINEVIWGTVGFLTVLLFLWKFGAPAIKKTMDARTERIRTDLESAEAQRTEAQDVLAQYQAQLADARGEAARIIEEARQAADETKRSLEAQYQAEVDERRQRELADIDGMKAQAMAQLRSEVTELAIGAAEQVVQRNLDRDANVALVEQYIDQVNRVGAQS